MQQLTANDYFIFVSSEQDEDGDYISTVPEFPDLVMFGATQEEAINDMKILIEDMITWHLKNNKELPPPKFKFQDGVDV